MGRGGLRLRLSMGNEKSGGTELSPDPLWPALKGGSLAVPKSLGSGAWVVKEAERWQIR